MGRRSTGSFYKKTDAQQEAIELRQLVLALRIVAVAFLAVFAWDSILFRSGLYGAWVEPQSRAGATRGALLKIDYNYSPGRRNVLVLGNSRIGEGFSQSLSDNATAQSSLHFINGSIAGTDPRIWYYLLRAIDPEFDRFSALVLPVHYDLLTNPESMADYAADIGFLLPLLKLQDINVLPASFNDAGLRSQARRAILFPTQPMRADLVAMLASPMRRFKRVSDFNKNYLASLMNYPGNPNALPEISLDPKTLEPISWDGVDEKWKAGLTDYFRWLRMVPSPATLDSNERYYREWLTRIATPYHAKGIPIYLVEVPRGPWLAPQANPLRPQGAIRELIDAGLVEALPGDTFVDLEYPRYFFDREHMNRAGRERFTPRLVERIAAMLH